jgi:hypothetical protein
MHIASASRSHATELAARLPLWPIVVIPTALGIRAYRRHIVTGRAEARRFCRRCGYDLRASTGRCAECGTPMPPPPPQLTKQVS